MPAGMAATQFLRTVGLPPFVLVPTSATVPVLSLNHYFCNWTWHWGSSRLLSPTPGFVMFCT